MEHVTELEHLLKEFDLAKLPTTKAKIAEQTLKILIPLVIQQNAEIFKLKARLNKCQK